MVGKRLSQIAKPYIALREYATQQNLYVALYESEQEKQLIIGLSLD